MKNNINKKHTQGNAIPIMNIKMMTDEKWNQLAKKQASEKSSIKHNESIFAEIMKDWNCSYTEAVASCEFNCNTLSETRKVLAQSITYNRLLLSLLPEAIKYIRNDRYKNKNVSEDFIRSKARELVEYEAEQFTNLWGELDEYDTMTEAEKEAVVYGSSDI